MRRLLSLGLCQGDRLCTTTPNQFAAIFRRAIVFFGLGDFNFKPYSIRRGGATLHYKLNGNITATVLRGRWLSMRAARIYIEDGMAMLARMSLEPMRERDVTLLANWFIGHLRGQARS